MIAPFMNSWLWVLDPPQPTLTPEGIQMIPRRVLILSLFSSIFSYALADTYLALPRHPSVASESLFSMCLSNMGLTTALFVLMLVFIYQILRVIHDPRVPFQTLLSIGAVAVIPLHLTLPLALVCHPFRIAGFFIYGLSELAIGVSVLRRMAWDLQPT